MKTKDYLLIGLFAVFLFFVIASIEMRHASYTQVALELGFDQSQEHPLLIGDRETVMSGDFEASGTVFYISDSGDSTAGPLLVAYVQEDGKVEVMELPMSAVVFEVISDELSPSLKINLDLIEHSVQGGAIIGRDGEVNLPTSLENKSAAQFLQDTINEYPYKQMVEVRLSENDLKRILGQNSEQTQH